MAARRDPVNAAARPRPKQPRSATTEEDLAYAPVHCLATMVRDGSISPRELVELYLSRINALDPRLQAFVEIYEVEARAASEYASAQAALGHFRGPLHGIPIALKDLVDITGRQTTAGSATRKGNRAEVTASVAKRLGAAGMIVLGKTHTVEFAFGGWGTNAHMGMPRNPWDGKEHRVPGGSSSGSAVAVAAALAPAAIGTDTGGSVRIPASLCGVVGLKPTVGRVSKAGIVPLSRTLDSVGPIARCVEDAAILFAAIAGPDAADPMTEGLPGCDPLAGLRRGVRGLRLAVPSDKDLEGADGDVLARFSEALKAAERIGATLEEIRLPPSFERSVEAVSVIIGAEAYHEHGEWVEAHAEIDPAVRRRILAGKDIAAHRYLRALEKRKEDTRAFLEALGDCAALLTPTTQIPAATLAEVDEDRMPLSRFTRPINYYGGCALALPMGVTASGLPTSLQVAGRPFDEATVLRIGWALEQRGGLLAERPPLKSLVSQGYSRSP